MNDVAIRVTNLGKRYRIGRSKERPDTLVGTLLQHLRNPARNLRQLRQLSRFGEADAVGTDADDVLWALRDVSFEVKRGEVLGIIGRNGSGKSTLLKLLSRITHPTTGRIELQGRIAGLLEVGTGFHPELTGRDNIYLNGTILGMTKREIDRKFDEIVDFSGVESFIDTPVKRFSSGMRVRLAFSIAAHLDPEILLVDEVLAVGDADFQQKSIGKMREAASNDRTVVFISHDLSAITTLCTRALLLQRGSIAASGSPAAMIERYRLSPTQAQNGQVPASSLTTATMSARP